MKQKYYKLIIAGFAISFLFACNPQHKLMKQARVQSSAGMSEEAANLYYNILLSDPRNKEAKAGLHQNAAKVISDKFARFSKQVIDGKIEEALNTYRYAKGYAANAASVGVEVAWPDEYDEVYRDIRQEYTDSQYDLAIELMQNRKYEAAEKVFERIAVHDSSYKNVSVLRLNTVIEPLYNRALQQYNAGMFRESYYAFNRIVMIDDQYKDAVKMRSLALQQATLIVGVLPLYDDISNKAGRAAGLELPDKIADKLSLKQGAYVKIANVRALHRDLENRGFGKISDAEQAYEAGKNLGLGYAIFLRLDSFSYVQTKPETYVREAYESVTENILNPYTKTYSSISKFKRVTYTDKTEGQYLHIALTYALIDIKSRQVISTSQVSLSTNDEVHAAVFNGNSANLYPELPEGNYLPQVSREWRDMFMNKEKKLVPSAEFIQRSFNEVAIKVAQSVQIEVK